MHGTAEGPGGPSTSAARGLVACFDGKVTERVIDAIAEMYPVKVVFRDSSFEEDAQKMNLFELFKQKCGWTEQEVRNNVKVI